MKRVLLIIAGLLATNISAQKITRLKGLDTTMYFVQGQLHKRVGNRLEIEGVYRGKDLFIKNSYGGKGIGFCITGVKVNGNITTDEINTTLFKIDLAIHKLKLNESFKLVIRYKDSCDLPEPLLMNPTVIKPPDPSGISYLTIEGKNFNQNLFVVNPRSGKNYGIKEVFVNGKKVELIQTDIVDVNFYKMGIQFEEKVKIEFKYEEGCDPFIINPEVINY